MRATGVVDSPLAEVGSHLCWLYRGHPSFKQAATRFLEVGAANGERLLYTADRSVEELADDLAPLGDVEQLVETGALLLVPLSSLYRDHGFDGGRQVEAYRAMTEQALADGHRGLRLAADATELVRRPDDRAAFVPYELAVDRLMAELPLSALCAYDEAVLGAAATELCAVHPAHNAFGDTSAGFCLYHDEGRLFLAGELDLANRTLLDGALTAVRTLDDEVLVVDLRSLRFADADALVRIGQLAATVAADGRELRLTGASALLRRCCEVLGLEHLLAEPLDA